MDTINITKDFEIFDTARYYKHKPDDSSIAFEKLPNGTYIEYSIGTTVSGGDYNETNPYSYFTLHKNYYINGYIKEKGALFNVPWGSFKKGVWYEFDEKGKLVKEVDYDKDYAFSFDDVVTFCEKENIKLDKGPILQSTGFHTKIRRNFSKQYNKYIWIVNRLKTADAIEEITLDGQNGEVLNRKENKYINN